MSTADQTHMDFVDDLVQLDQTKIEDAETLVYTEEEHPSGLSPRLANHESTSVSESTATESADDSLDSEGADRTIRSAPKRKRTIKKRSSETRKRERYQTVSNNTRLELIQLVEHRGSSLKDAANELNINYSTAKSIFAMYKKEGRILKKVNRRRFDVPPSELMQIQSQGSQSNNTQSNSTMYSQASASNASTAATTAGYQMLMGHQFPKNFAPRMCCPNCSSMLTLKQVSQENGTTRFTLEIDNNAYPQLAASLMSQMAAKPGMRRHSLDSAMAAKYFSRMEESRPDPTDEYLQTTEDGVYLGEDNKHFDTDFSHHGLFNNRY